MRILLATDGSECAEEAARFLTRFRFSPEDEILILHVIGEIPYKDDYASQVRHAIRRVAPQILKSAREILKPVRAAVRAAEEEGYPDTTIIEKAVNAEVDLIVMGSRGIKSVRAVFLGSSTRAVAINSPIPLLAVKRPPWKHEKIKVLFATDGSKTAEAAGKFLASMPLRNDTGITIVHAAEVPAADMPKRFSAALERSLREALSGIKKREKREAAETIAATESLFSRFENVDGVIRFGDPAREILRLEKTLRPDMIVVGCRGLRGAKGMMGSISRRILGNSRASVLIGRPCRG